ncbi:MAG TPA: carbohydrate porin [Gemmatimonadales bacterium]|nr:carbohydrate porin [Gemmatimonadales bacterium]
MLAAVLFAIGLAAPARAQEAGAPPWLPRLLAFQVTAIGQWLPPFRSPYAGPNSLTGSGDQAVSHTYGLYLGSHLLTGLGAYLDLEMAEGKGISRVTGLGGFTNGDVIRKGSADLGTGPYIAQAFLRYAVRLSPDSTRVGRAQDQLPGWIPDRRVELTAGKLAANDVFDLNRYANGTRIQFMNWGLFQNTAWDFAADTRGYTNGVAIAYVAPSWTLRLGSFQMPTAANGNVFDRDLVHARGDNIELTVMPTHIGSVVRLLAYQNHARMGDYREAIARALARDTVPDIVADDQPGRRKYGFGLNVEQPVADSGETGMFLRLGWNDGHTESFAFTEVDRHLSTGVQMAGGRWARPADRLGIALLVHGLSADHRDYLARGGRGFLLGDGRLTYGAEEVAEGYYRFQVGSYVEVTPDVQVIRHPGYNQDRGPAAVLALRVNARY